MRFELLRRFARWSGHDDQTVMDWHAPAAGYSHARSSQGADCFDVWAAYCTSSSSALSKLGVQGLRALTVG